MMIPGTEHMLDYREFPILYVDDEPENLYLSMSAIDGDPPRPTGFHIYVGSKAVWHEITDDLEQYEVWPPD